MVIYVGYAHILCHKMICPVFLMKKTAKLSSQPHHISSNYLQGTMKNVCNLLYLLGIWQFACLKEKVQSKLS